MHQINRNRGGLAALMSVVLLVCALSSYFLIASVTHAQTLSQAQTLDQFFNQLNIAHVVLPSQTAFANGTFTPGVVQNNPNDANFTEFVYRLFPGGSLHLFVGTNYYADDSTNYLWTEDSYFASKVARAQNASDGIYLNVSNAAKDGTDPHTNNIQINFEGTKVRFYCTDGRYYTANVQYGVVRQGAADGTIAYTFNFPVRGAQ